MSGVCTVLLRYRMMTVNANADSYVTFCAFFGT